MTPAASLVRSVAALAPGRVAYDPAAPVPALTVGDNVIAVRDLPGGYSYAVGAVDDLADGGLVPSAADMRHRLTAWLLMALNEEA